MCRHDFVLHCIVFVNLYSAAHSSDIHSASSVRAPREEGLRRESCAIMRWDPERIVRRREEGGAFHWDCRMGAKDLVWTISVLTRGTRRTCMSRERRGRCEAAGRGKSMWSLRYFGARPSLDFSFEAK